MEEQRRHRAIAKFFYQGSSQGTGDVASTWLISRMTTTELRDK